MNIVLEKGGAAGPANGLAPAHFFPLEGGGLPCAPPPPTFTSPSILSLYKSCISGYVILSLLWLF